MKDAPAGGRCMRQRGGQQGPLAQPVASGRAPRRGRRGGRAPPSLACGLAACGAVDAWIPSSPLPCGVLRVRIVRSAVADAPDVGRRGAGAAYSAMAAGSWRGRTVP